LGAADVRLLTITGGAVALEAASTTPHWDVDHWRNQAACRQTEVDMFFPAGVTGVAEQQIRAAKAVCGACPVKEPCLAFAIRTNQEYGVWGGTSEEERRSLRRAWRARRRLKAVS
jgi:WhiB family redox-sensing transcriptional regulator